MLERLSELTERWPVEDWAANTSYQLRRMRRRLARRKVRVAVAVASACIVTAVGGNALWSQTARHPAPLWTDGAHGGAVLGSHGVPGEPRLAEIRTVVDDDATDDDALSGMVRKVQEGLGANGLYHGALNGDLDEDTAAAIRTFERTAGLDETGEPSLALLAAISADGDPLADIVERRSGAANDGPARAAPDDVDETRAAPETAAVNVADIQRLLNERGFGPLTIDGKMGARTRQALDSFAVQKGFDDRSGLSPEVLRALAGGDA